MRGYDQGVGLGIGLVIFPGALPCAAHHRTCTARALIHSHALIRSRARALACVFGSCWCYVCEVPAAKCEQWDSKDAKVPAHCNAHAGNRFWASIKAAAVHALRCAEATIIDG